MAYAVAADLITRFGEAEIIQLTDRNFTQVINLTVLDKGIADASAIIDGYLRNAYSLPLASIPAELNRVCADLTRYLLMDDRATDQVKMRRDDAMSWLKDLSAGRASLGMAVDTGGQAITSPAPTGGGIAFSASPRVFNLAALARL